jgi:ATP-binding cassette subfamily B protein/subfamily B ATP-binding cassette protein MsbA
VSETTTGSRPALVRRLAHYLRPYRLPFAMALGQVFMMSVVELLRPWPLKIVVDNVVGDRPLPFGIAADGAGKPALLAVCVLGQVLLQGMLGALSYWNNRTTITIGQNMVNDLRSDLYQHLQRLSLAFHARRQVGDLLYRLTADTYAIQALTMNGVFPVVSAAMFLVGMTLVLLRIDWLLTVIALAICPVLYVAIQRMTGRISDVSVSARELESGVYTIVQHSLSAIRVVQAFTQEEAEHRRFLQQSSASLTANRRLYLVQTAYSGVVSTLITAGTALVLWFGARRAMAGQMTVGDVLVFLGYVASLYAPVSALSQTYGTIQGAKAGIWRVFEILEEPEVVASGPLVLERAAIRGEVGFERVDFSYDGKRLVLSDISFVAGPGTSVALVGPTGAGKTTLVSLLPRFYDPSAGRVLLDGKDLREFQLASLRRHISMVLQPPIVFPATVRENIAYGRPGASLAEIEHAAELAQLVPFLRRLPQGLDTRIGEGGANLSEGERQRLTIARALLRDAPILILDEPTASVDAETEALLVAGLKTLMEGRTIFIIAHRLSTVRDASQIVVLREGRVVESGAYEALVAQQGFFSRLVRFQSGEESGSLLAVGE